MKDTLVGIGLILLMVGGTLFFGAFCLAIEWMLARWLAGLFFGIEY